MRRKGHSALYLVSFGFRTGAERKRGKRARGQGGANVIIQQALVPGIIVNVDGHSTESADFGGELVQAGVVLSVGEFVG